jgi:hypothetical protein
MVKPERNGASPNRVVDTSVALRDASKPPQNVTPDQGRLQSGESEIYASVLSE